LFRDLAAGCRCLVVCYSISEAFRPGQSEIVPVEAVENRKLANQQFLQRAVLGFSEGLYCQFCIRPLPGHPSHCDVIPIPREQLVAQIKCHERPLVLAVRLGLLLGLYNYADCGLRGFGCFQL